MEKVTPLCWAIHANNSAKILNNFGADRSLKGRQVSKYKAFSHSVLLLEDACQLGGPEVTGMHC